MPSMGVPLHCSICPKKPNFSDVSHLLTHVASKGHLSHYYKFKVQASGDDTSRQMIDIYDQWYSDWNIEGLMSERLTFKKRPKRTTLASSLRPAKKTVPSQNIPAEFQVDPQLSFTQSKMDVFADSKRGMRTPPRRLVSPVFLQPKGRGPRLHLWSTKCPTSFEAVLLAYDSPATPSKPPPPLGNYQKPAPLAQMLTNIGIVKDIDDGDDVTEATKLKGVLWPGMNIFDAATPTMKRKRNQKKETSVVDRLEKNASGVEATEMIFTPSGSLYKQRPISGKVDFDSSPYKLVQFSSPPKKKPTSRAPLAPRDPNRHMMRRTSTAACGESSTSFSGNANALNREGRPSKKKKRDFAVFDEREYEQMNENNALRLLTSEFHDIPQHDTTAHLTHSLEEPLASLYRPAVQNTFLGNAFDAFQQPLYGYFPFYGHMGFDGFFSYESQRNYTEEHTETPDNKTITAEPSSDVLDPA